MKSYDQILKIKATVLYILNCFPEGLDYIHLFKIMYFAQREHLVLYGMTLMDDSFVTRKHGPVPSFTYKVLRSIEGKVNMDSEVSNLFSDTFQIDASNEHQNVYASVKPDMDELSASNVKLLDKYINECRNIKAFDLSDMSHDKAWVNAYKKSQKTGDSITMTPYDIAAAGGASKEMLSIIRERQLVKQLMS